MLFSIAGTARRLTPLDDQERRECVQAAVVRFEATFPRIQFNVGWQSDSLNAQAYRLGEQRCVMLFGGLVRHVALQAEGLAVAIAHEVGHHEGGAPYHRFYPWLSSERRADEWAAEVGLPLVFGRRAPRIRRAGVQQLFDLLAEASRTRSGTAVLTDCHPDHPCLACRAAIFRVRTTLRCTAQKDESLA